MLPLSSPKQAIERTVREEWGRILSALVKSVGDIQLAEDCLQDAVVKALDKWEHQGMPHSPAAWLLTVARRGAIDQLRRDQSFNQKQSDISYLMDLENVAPQDVDDSSIPDKRLEMIFTCCHPALEDKTQVALTLRTLGGLTTEEIAAAFLDKPAAMAQRLLRAKNKIKLAAIPYDIPDAAILPNRIRSVLSVIYFIFNEGYSASSGDSPLRADLCDEAIRLARIVLQLMPEETEVAGLLALMLLHDSRRLARTDGQGAIVSLEHQNRRRWDQGKITQGAELLKKTLIKKRVGPYQLQAAISALHAESDDWQSTDWPQISALYALLHDIQPSPVIRLNHALAVSYARSVEEALQMMDAAAGSGALEFYQPYYAAMADLLVRSGKSGAAASHLKKAIELSENQAEADFLQRKLNNLDP